MSFVMPGKILEEYTLWNNGLGLVQFGETRRPIFLDLVPDAHIGDYVRVHVDFAMEHSRPPACKRPSRWLGLLRTMMQSHHRPWGRIILTF
jgi:hydrogenase maturation factor